VIEVPKIAASNDGAGGQHTTGKKSFCEIGFLHVVMTLGASHG